MGPVESLSLKLLHDLDLHRPFTMKSSSPLKERDDLDLTLLPI